MYKHIRGNFFFLLSISKKPAPLLEQEHYDNISEACYINYCISQAAKVLFYKKAASCNGTLRIFNSTHAEPTLSLLYSMWDNSSINTPGQPELNIKYEI